MGLYIDDIQKEQTLPDKKRIRFIYHLNCVHYVTKGKGYYNGRLLKKGDGFVCFKNNFADYYPDADDPWEYVWVRFRGEAASPENVPCNFETFCFKFNVDDTFNNMVDFISSSKKEYVSEHDFAKACLSLLFSRHIVSDNERTAATVLCRHSEYARKYIAANFHKRITPEGIAKTLGISRAYLRNVFYESFGVSPRDYIINVRIERAKELLILDSVSINDISNSVGYSDVLQFSRIFKKHTGMSPTEFRKTNIL